MGIFMTTFMVSSVLVSAIQASSWTPAEQLKVKMISDVQISPENQKVLFVVTEPQFGEIKGSNISRIYQTDTKGTRAPSFLTPEDSSAVQPRFSPDGRWIAFLSDREDKIKQLYLMSPNGEEVVSLTRGPKPVQVFAWSPDSRMIAFVMEDETELAKNRKKTSEAYLYKERMSVNRLWVIDVAVQTPTPRALTTDEYCVKGVGDFGLNSIEFDWSPDSKTLVFSHSPSMDMDSFYLDSSLASVDAGTGKITPWEKHSRYESLPRYSPNGEKVAYLMDDTKEKYALSRSVAIRSSDGGSVQLLAKTLEEGSSLQITTFLRWTPNGEHLLFVEPKGTKYHVAVISADGSPVKELDTGDHFFKELTLSSDGSLFGFVLQTPHTPPEVHVAKWDDFNPKKISNLNETFLSYPQGKTEVISWKSIDGMTIDGLLTYPVNYQEGKQYPLLLVIHGGPMGFYDESFLGSSIVYPLASFAEAGYLILRPNPRGSCGYGKSFRCANFNDWGGGDFQDIMSGVDALIEKGIANPSKMGVMGWSYGGYMTAWTITQTSRFKAASMGAGLSNLVSMMGTTDLHRFITDYLGDSYELKQKRSPLYHADKVTTPCLIQHGTEDKRVPVAQAYEFYHALDRTGIKPELVLYPDMGHRLPDPNMLLDAMQRNFEWFQKHLQ